MQEDTSKITLNDFDILKELGKGGFGSVFLVRITDQTRNKIMNEVGPMNMPESDLVALKKVYMGQ